MTLLPNESVVCDLKSFTESGIYSVSVLNMEHVSDSYVRSSEWLSAFTTIFDGSWFLLFGSENNPGTIRSLLSPPAFFPVLSRSNQAVLL